MIKIVTMAASSLIGIALLAAQPPPPDGPDRPPPPAPPPKKKGEGGPAGDLRRAYELLRRLRADGHSLGRPEERLRDWTERSADLYRKGIKAYGDGDLRLAHEYGAAAHDLARAVDHSRNASLYEGRDTDLPPPPDTGPEGDGRGARIDLNRAYERIRHGLEVAEGPDAKFYLESARDLYNAARRDAQAGRAERAGELARAAEAITHVPEHLDHAARDDREPPEAKEKRKEKGKEKRKAYGKSFEKKRPPPPPDDGPEPKDERYEPKRPPRPADDGPEPKRPRRVDELPPPL